MSEITNITNINLIVTDFGMHHVDNFDWSDVDLIVQHEKANAWRYKSGSEWDAARAGFEHGSAEVQAAWRRIEEKSKCLQDMKSTHP